MQDQQLSERLWPSIDAASVEFRENEIYNLNFGDIYFSVAEGHSIFEESQFVFFENAGVAGKMKSQAKLVIGEMGFGAGINFFTTIKNFFSQNTGAPCMFMQYVSFEKNPLPRSFFETILEHPAFADIKNLVKSFVKDYPDFLPGFHCLKFHSGNRLAELLLFYGDANWGLAEIAYAPKLYFESGCQDEGIFDCWYLDGFKPSVNPEMFALPLLKEIFQKSRIGASLATYSAAGSVRRNLQEAGFEVRKIAGFHHKRHMVTAAKVAAKTPGLSGFHKGNFPWEVPVRSRELTKSSRIAIIGAGLAGLSIADELNQICQKRWGKNFSLTIFEKEAKIAPLSSGNSRAVLFPILSAQPTVFSSYSWQAFEFARRKFERLQQQCDLQWQPCGVFQVFTDDSINRRVQSAIKNHDLEKYQDSAGTMFFKLHNLSTLDVIDKSLEGIFFPEGGTINPGFLCQYLARNLDVRLSTSITGLDLQQGVWQLQCQVSGKSSFLEFDQVIICNSYASDSFTQTSWLNLAKRWGQTAILPSRESLLEVKYPICGDGYLTQELGGNTIIGASFRDESPAKNSKNDLDFFKQVRAAESLEIMTRLRKWLPKSLAQTMAGYSDAEVLAAAGASGCRVSCEDHLPVIGPVPDFHRFTKMFSGLSNGPRYLLPKLLGSNSAPYCPGLYIFSGLGSRGLLYSQLGAKLLAAQMGGEVLATQKTIAQAFAPARWLVKLLKKRFTA